MVQKHGPGRIPVSVLVRAARCPVRYSYEKDMPYSESPRYTISRQLASWFSHSSAGISGPGVIRVSSLFPEADQIWDEVLTLLTQGRMTGPDPLTPVSEPVSGEDLEDLRQYFTRCIKAWDGRAFPPSTDEDLSVSSDRYCVVGSVDLYDAVSRTLSIIRPGKAPSLGVWQEDRLRIAAYAQGIYETLSGHPVATGKVVYMSSGMVRSHAPSARDYRALWRAVRAAREVNSGYVPAKPGDAPCKGCPWQDRCSTAGGRRLSDLL